MKSTLIYKYPNEVAKLFYYFKSLNIEEVGTNYKTFKNFIYCIEKYSENISDDKDVQKKFKGDILEIFAELFFICLENDPDVGLSKYNPISIDQDYGCDGEGVNAAGNRCAVQVKFRSNPQDIITYEELAKTDSSAKRLLKIDTSIDKTLWVFTSAYDISNSVRKVMGNSIVLVGYNQISYKVDNNVGFWDNVWEIIKNV